MLKTLLQNIWLKKAAYAISTGMLSLAITHSVYAAPAQDPLFLTAPVTPLMMLNMSNDHQLFFKAYDDYSDITNSDGGEPDGNADTTYIHSYDYYGYFDSKKCYAYQNNRFEPAVIAGGDKYCNGSHWSGNFLNWATMTRMDAVRKILYGGLRQVDTASETVLERAFLPNDAHSFAKYYNGTDIGKLTPFTSITMGSSNTASTGITICNTTNPATRNQYSQNVSDPPHMLVAEGNYSLWASNERWQCRWRGDISNSNEGKNNNVASQTGIYAHNDSPRFNQRLGNGNYNVRVKVCDANFTDNENENCKSYGANQKPAGLLQEFGESGSIAFGLFTGSYGKNKSGGVLRKNIGVMTDELNEDGTFKLPVNGIIKTLDLLRIYGYNFNDGTYNNGDNCSWALSSFNDGNCSNWGNPQSEIYLESLRYLAGLSATTSFLPPASKTDASRINGLNVASWTKPVTSANYCAPLSVIQFNASMSSYDGDALDGASSIGITDLNGATDYVGEQEDIHGNRYFVGQSVTSLTPATENNNQLCTAKEINNLSSVRGTCSDAPRLEGSFQIAGLAHHARKTGIPLTGVTQLERQTVRTYGVSLAPAVPKVDIPVPGGDGKQVTIMPACRNTTLNPDANCAIVDFKIIEQETLTEGTQTVNTGLLYVNWEDSEQGGDYDQDMWGTMRYTVSSTEVAVTTHVMAQSSGDSMGLGYIISGTTEDGFKVHSGVNNFIYGSTCTSTAGNRCTCRNDNSHNVCNSADWGPRTATYDIGPSAAESLEQPLYYAAKWGGYSDELVKEANSRSVSIETLVKDRDPSDTYFFATDPRNLERSLRAAFSGVASSIGTASAVSTSSTRLTEGSLVYQALFDSEDWSGELKILTLNSDSEVVESSPKISTDNSNTFASRKIVTHNPDSAGANKLVDFQWENLSEVQRAALNQDDDESVGQKRLAWLRGDRSNENASGGMRIRKKLLGDIVNSSPAYSGNKNARYLQLPGDAGTSYAAYTKDKVVYVGANDGMLHAFNATTLNEIFAFIPTGVYPKLANITKPDYGMGANPHQYLVDGALTVADYYTGSAWKTVVVGTLGAGGQGVYALDVTNPSTPNIIFERGAADGVGYIIGQPIVAQMKNGSWAVIFENGYENGTSKLFVIDLNNPGGANSGVIDTGEGTGLSGVALLPNASGQVEYAYAGDLLGNLWKFDLSGESPSDWDSEKIFTAQYTSGGQTYNQPITGAPTLGRNALKNNATMVYFGTGKYLDAVDNLTPAIPRQSFYALADTGGVIPKSSLHQKTIVQAAGATTRTIDGERNTNNDVVTSAVDWATKRGWYLDFDAVNGERVITKPLLAFDRLIFTTLVPSAVACSYGGSSWLMELVAVGDKNIAHNILGEDANSELENAVLGEMSVGVGSDTIKLIPCDITGDCDLLEGELVTGSRGRMSWRQLR